ncbi:MAG: DUF5652 family protein [Candidatus Pacebacteria bacterium]|nr:DUF5652 family protein [Candidatus Paceibacterota bacterium]
MNPYAHPFLQEFSVAGMHTFGPGIASLFFVTIAIIAVWSLAWEGVALWHAARNRQTAWFVVLLIVHTAGILDIIYILFFRKDNNAAKGTLTVAPATASTTTPAAPASGDSSAPAA